MSDCYYLFALWKFWKNCNPRQDQPNFLVEAFVSSFEKEPPEIDLLESMVLCECRFKTAGETSELIRYTVTDDEDGRATLSQTGWQAAGIRIHPLGEVSQKKASGTFPARAMLLGALDFYGLSIESLIDPASTLLEPYIDYGPSLDIMLEIQDMRDERKRLRRTEKPKTYRRPRSGMGH